jgi:hypothetical protein
MNYDMVDVNKQAIETLQICTIHNPSYNIADDDNINNQYDKYDRSSEPTSSGLKEWSWWG